MRSWPACCRNGSDGEELHYSEVWNTSTSRNTPSDGGLQMVVAIADLKARGNAALKSGAPSRKYSRGHVTRVPQIHHLAGNIGCHRVRHVMQAMPDSHWTCTQQRCERANETRPEPPAASTWRCCSAIGQQRITRSASTSRSAALASTWQLPNLSDYCCNSGETCDGLRRVSDLRSDMHVSSPLCSRNTDQHLRLSRQALLDCKKATELWPRWSKPYFRMASAHLALSNWDAAMQACRNGEALLDRKVRSCCLLRCGTLDGHEFLV